MLKRWKHSLGTFLHMDDYGGNVIENKEIVNTNGMETDEISDELPITNKRWKYTINISMKTIFH